MYADEKFNKRKARRLEVMYYTSMNLAPESTWGKEAERVKLMLRDLGDSDDLWFHVLMSRREAKELGEALLRCGNRAVEGEKELTTTQERVG